MSASSADAPPSPRSATESEHVEEAEAVAPLGSGDGERATAAPSVADAPLAPAQPSDSEPSPPESEQKDSHSGPEPCAELGSAPEPDDVASKAAPTAEPTDNTPCGDAGGEDAVKEIRRLSLDSKEQCVSAQGEAATESKGSPAAAEPSTPTSVETEELPKDKAQTSHVAVASPLPSPLDPMTRQSAWDKENFDYFSHRFVNEPRAKTAPPVGKTVRKARPLERIPVLADVTEAYYARTALNTLRMAAPFEDAVEPAPAPTPAPEPRRAPQGVLSNNSAATNAARRTATSSSAKPTVLRTSPKVRLSPLQPIIHIDVL